MCVLLLLLLLLLLSVIITLADVMLLQLQHGDDTVISVWCDKNDDMTSCSVKICYVKLVICRAVN